MSLTGPPPVEELDKPNVVNFSVLMSQMAYPGGSEQVGRNDPSKMVVVNEDDTAGALVGAALARGFFGPLLVSPSDALTKNLKDEVQRVRPHGVYVIGDEDQLAPQVVTDLEAAGVDDGIIRLSGPTPAHVAKAAAEAMDLRSAKALEEGQVAAFDAAVVVNPDSDDAAAAAALAAAARAPILFTGRDEVPAPTTEAIASLKIGTTLVVGGPDSVSDAVLAQLPSAERLGEADPEAVSMAVAKEMKERGLPSNIVYVTAASRPLDQAVLGAAVGRLGGLMVVTPGASAERAIDSLSPVQPAAAIDRMVVARSASPGGANPLLIGLSLLLGVTGLVLLVLALTRSRRKSEPVTSDPVPRAASTT